MATKKFDPDSLSSGFESLLGKAADVLSRGREELLKQSRIGKAKLFDLTQLRRERARLMQRLGEEAYRGMQAGSLTKDDLKRTYQRVVEMDEQIAAKEAEIDRLQREASAAGAPASAPSASKPATGASKKAEAGPKPSAPPTPPKSAGRNKRRMGAEDDGEE